MTNMTQELINHFMKYVPPITDDSKCMEWLGYINPSGYGKMGFDSKCYRAHRLAYKIWKGRISKNKEVCHSCDNKKCINPQHLFLGTHSQNMQDMADKKRNPILLLKGSQKKQSKLKESDIPQIRMFLAGGVYQRDIAKLFGVHQTVIRDINLKRTWRHV